MVSLNETWDQTAKSNKHQTRASNVSKEYTQLLLAENCVIFILFPLTKLKVAGCPNWALKVTLRCTSPRGRNSGFTSKSWMKKSIENGPSWCSWTAPKNCYFLENRKKLDGWWPWLFTEPESVKSGKVNPSAAPAMLGPLGQSCKTWKCACTTMKPWKDTMCEQLSNWKSSKIKLIKLIKQILKGVTHSLFSRELNRSGPWKGHAIWHSTWLTFWPHGTWARIPGRDWAGAVQETPPDTRGTPLLLH